MSNYRRELLDEEGDGAHMMGFPSNLTSIGNPHFSSSRQLVLDDSQPTESSEPVARSGSRENFSISFITSNSYDRKRAFWGRLTSFEKLLTLVVLILGLVIFTLSLILLIQPSPLLQVHLAKEDPSTTFCLTPECISIASSVIDSLDTAVDPCNNFYDYACGGWVKKNPLPDGHASWGTFGKLTQDNQLILKNILEDSKIKFSGAEYKAKILYESCMDRNSTVEKLAAKPLQDFIDLIGGWNISGGFDVRAWNLQTKLTLMHNKYNRGGLFEWSVSADEKHSTLNVLDLQQGGFVMPRDYYLNKTDEDEVILAYLDFMTKIGTLLGGDETATRTQMKQVLKLEREIAQILTPPDQMRDDEKTYHRMTLKELSTLSPFLDWTDYFRMAFAPIRRNITDTEPIIVYSPEYMGNLSVIIADYLQSDAKKTVLVNAIVWSVVQPLVTYLSKPFREAAKTFSQALIGSEGTTSKWRYCISDTGGVLGFALGSMFVRSAFRGESKNKSEVMIQQIKDAFKEHLEQVTWMDSETLRLAIEKADSITDMIGFPDFILNEKKLNKRYEGLVIKEDLYFKNSISANVFILNEFVKKLDKPANRSEWDMPPPVVNAYYAPTKNQIAFPAGILQSPFYDPSRPASLNFGAMGVVMGHELTHAFDDQGREYDKKGDLHEWWQESTIRKFKEKMKCFEGQYSKYELGKDHVNGKQTLGENVADAGGLQNAFRAFTRWAAHHEDKPVLPGLAYTDTQLFFIGFAQVWCSVNTPEALRLQIRNDPHTPSQYRVIGTLSNSVDFARAFNCSAGSPMNPTEKCVVW